MHHLQSARRRRAPTRLSARAGEGTGGGAAAQPSSPAPTASGSATALSGEKGGGKKEKSLGFGGGPAGRGFDPLRAAPGRRIRSDGQGVIVGRMGRIRHMRALCGRRAEPVQRSGRWLLGHEPRRGRARAARGQAVGHIQKTAREHSLVFFQFQKQFWICFDEFE